MIDRINLNIGEEDEREKWVTAPERESTPEPVTVPAPAVPAPSVTPAPAVPAGV